MDKAAEAKMEYLLSVIQDLSLTRSLDAVTALVRSAARELTGADGATFILRDGDLCYYADEDAIGPLWKGKRFPVDTCISGWVMAHRQSTTIQDIYSDSRIPAEVYRPTFVKSLAMVPIRVKDPNGAIGVYWAREKEVTANELKLLEALANSTSIAIENIQLYNSLESKVLERTSALEAFSFSVSHDLKAPLRGIIGFAKILEEDYGSTLDSTAQEHLSRIQTSAARMTELIEGLLELSHVTRGEVNKTKVNLSALARQIADEIIAESPLRPAEIVIREDVTALGDPRMLQTVLENLLRNAWKFSRHATPTRIEVGKKPIEDKSKAVYYVKDNGVGFNPTHAGRLFEVFQRLHTSSEFEGTGIGLATVQRIVSRHGGHVWADSKEGQGAEFCFELPG